MKATRKYGVAVLLLLASAAAQNHGAPAVLQTVTAVPDGTDLRVEFNLSASVTPLTQTAVNPDRILLDFPNTTFDAKMPTVNVNANGVGQIRAVQLDAAPLITRVVVDLDSLHTYSVDVQDERVIVKISPASARKGSHGAPAAAKPGSLTKLLHKKRQTSNTATEDNQTATSIPPPPPPAPNPGYQLPSENTSGQASASAATKDQVVIIPGESGSSAASNQISAPDPAKSAENATRPPAFPPATVIVGNPIPPGSEKNKESVTAVSADNTNGSESASALPLPVETPTNTPSPHTPPGSEEPVTSPVTIATATSSAANPTVIARSDDPSLHTVFKVKYVADGVAYLDGGHAQGLTEGMKLEVEESDLPARQGDSVNTRDPRVVAELEVSAVAETSAVTEIHVPKRPVRVGDLAYLSSQDAEVLVQQRALSATRQYPAVISFTEGDTLDEEVRDEIPKPPLPSVNRARGRIGFDTIETFSHGTSSVTSIDNGVVFRGDITRIGGTYWNLSGYWRGQLTKESVIAQQTLQETINRTYHLNMTYDNPNSSLVAGFGRLYLPWAPSLDTIDGGYFGVRLSKASTLGIFGGSTPDPSSWDYSPNRAIGGSFINFEGGEYNGFHYSMTTGAGMSMLNWAANDPFVFFEDNFSYKRTVAIYESAQFDSPKGNTQTPAPGPGLGRNFFTLRVNPHPRIELDANYNYFRQIPTFDPTLIGTGLLDKYLFQGFSAGGRVKAVKQLWVYSTLGQSNGTGDAKSSLNQMYGVAYDRVPWLDLRADIHYSRFNSSFGDGSYEAVSLSRQVSERLRLEVLLGQQDFASAITANTHSKFVTGTVETTLGPHYYLQGNFTTNRGQMSYDQIMFSIGYRFDSKRKGE